MNGGVSIDVWVAMCKALQRLHGNRPVTQEALNEMIRLSTEIENVFLKLPPAPKKPKRERA